MRFASDPDAKAAPADAITGGQKTIPSKRPFELLQLLSGADKYFSIYLT